MATSAIWLSSPCLWGPLADIFYLMGDTLNMPANFVAQVALCRLN